MTLRIEAGLSELFLRLEMVREPTGSPVSMYSRPIAFRISRCLDRGGASVFIGHPIHSSTKDSNRLKVTGSTSKLAYLWTSAACFDRAARASKRFLRSAQPIGI